MALEEVITTKVKKKLTKMMADSECFWFKATGGFFQRAGLPDFLIWQKAEDGHCIVKGLELKATGKKATPLQEATMELMELQNVRTLCTDDWEEAEEFIDRT